MSRALSATRRALETLGAPPADHRSPSAPRVGPGRTSARPRRHQRILVVKQRLPADSRGPSAPLPGPWRLTTRHPQILEVHQPNDVPGQSNGHYRFVALPNALLHQTGCHLCKNLKSSTVTPSSEPGHRPDDSLSEAKHDSK